MKQSFAWWCFKGRGIPDLDLLAGAARIGYSGVDLIDETLWGAARDAGLQVAAVAGHGTLRDGLNRRENAERITRELLSKIDVAHDQDIPVLLCFSGDRMGDGSCGLAAAAEVLSEVAPVAEQAGITLALELLNSKIDHPGYEADHTAWGVELCERVGSPAVKLLYDIYHMQIMEGDLVRTIRESRAHIAHYHTAGNPGRGALDENQEIAYPAVYRAIHDTGFEGFIGHEFTTTQPPLEALATAFQQCAAATASR